MTWVRSICRSIDYPNFIEPKEVQLPDRLAAEKPKFSGFVRYESSFHVQGNEKLLLEISDAAEGVELFVNGVSAGLQIVPPFIYNITSLVKKGENSIVIEVATTLERENGRKSILAILTQGKITGLTGITGVVTLYNAQ
jgi:hypothetical protein